MHPLFLPKLTPSLLLLQRLGNLNGAIEDYTKCLSIAASVTESTGPTPATLAAVHGNRAGLYKSQGKRTAALEDIQKAIELDPQNLKYRESLCLLYRVCLHIFDNLSLLIGCMYVVGVGTVLACSL